MSASSILTANVYSDNEIVVRTGRGTIIGGRLTAANVISATVIGSRSERLTELFVGEYPFVKQQREENEAYVKQLKEDAERYAVQMFDHVLANMNSAINAIHNDVGGVMQAMNQAKEQIHSANKKV